MVRTQVTLPEPLIPSAPGKKSSPTMRSTREDKRVDDVSRPSSAREAHEVTRILTLLAILTVVGLWLQHHLGFELMKLGWVVLLIGGWSVFSKAAEWLGKKYAPGPKVEKVFKQRSRRLLVSLSRGTRLYFIAGFVALMLLTVSSVAVRSATPDEPATVSIAAFDPRGAARHDSLRGDKPIARFPVFTTPFGRLFEVDADGYVPAQVAVYPLVAKQVVLGQHLTPSPSVLFRPFVEGIVALKDSAVFRVTRRSATGRVDTLARFTGGGASSFLLGRPRPITEAMLMYWDLEATASGAPPAARAELLITWRNVTQLEKQLELGPRDCLRAEIVLNGNVKEAAMVPLAGTAFVDVRMRETTGNARGAPSC
jgi:hypothetical protein